jgi:acetyl esterase/lipase
MPLDPSAQKFIDLLAAGRSTTSGDLDVATRRESFRGLLHLAGGPGPSTIASRDDGIDGAGGTLHLRLYTPPHVSNDAGPALLYFHGGGFFGGSLETHDPICRLLAEASGCRIVAADYRLAPEHPFPAAIDDGLTALTALTANPEKWNIDASRLAVGGDSVGGNLAAVICQEWRRLGHAPLAAQVLICPVLDAIGDLPSRRLFGNGYYLESKMIADDFACYGPAGADRSDPRLSPLRAGNFSGLPAAIIHAAEYDPVRDEALRYGELLRAAGVPATVTCHQGMIHLFYAFSRFIPMSRIALMAIGKELGEILSGRQFA